LADTIPVAKGETSPDQVSDSNSDNDRNSDCNNDRNSNDDSDCNSDNNNDRNSNDDSDCNSDNNNNDSDSNSENRECKVVLVNPPNKESADETKFQPSPQEDLQFVLKYEKKLITKMLPVFEHQLKKLINRMTVEFQPTQSKIIRKLDQIILTRETYTDATIDRIALDLYRLYRSEITKVQQLAISCIYVQISFKTTTTNLCDLQPYRLQLQDASVWKSACSEKDNLMNVYNNEVTSFIDTAELFEKVYYEFLSQSTHQSDAFKTLLESVSKKYSKTLSLAHDQTIRVARTSNIQDVLVSVDYVKNHLRTLRQALHNLLDHSPVHGSE